MRARCCPVLLALAFSLSCSSTEQGGSTPGKPDASLNGGSGGAMSSGSGGGGGSSGASAGGAGATAGGGSGGVSNTGGGSGSSSGGAKASDAGSDGGSPGDAQAHCTLTPSGPVTAQADGQVIELLAIVTTSGPGIEVNGFKGVTIRNVSIQHGDGPGIDFSNADDLVIDNVSVEHTGAPASGPNSSSDLNDINGYASARVQIKNARLTRGSSGVYLVNSPTSHLSFIEGHDFRGPFPRGQLVQWDKSNDGILEDFSVVNTSDSWTEDNVNVYKSTGLQIRRGLVDGNNSPSGVGVIFDGDTSTGVVEDVDAVHMGNGCFSNYAGADGNVFRRTRCRDNICTDQGRGLPSSNALMWSGNPALSAVRIEQSTYFAACNPGNIVWPASSFAIADVTKADFTPRSPLALSFCWE